MTLLGSIPHSFPAFVGIYWSKRLNQNEVPKVIKNIIKRDYDDHIPINWTIRSGRFLAKFKAKGVQKYIFFNLFGQINKTITELNFQILPAKIQRQIADNYSEFELISIFLVKKASGIKYELEVKSDFTSFCLLFDHDGKIISRKSERSIE